MIEPLSQPKCAKILEAAQARFLYYGVAKTTMRDIANDLGISVSNLYLYFENKQALVLAIANECRAAQDQVVASVLNNQALTPSQKLEAMLVKKHQHVTAFRTVYPQGRELIAYLLQEFPERIASWQSEMEKVILTILEEGVTRGCFHLENPAQSAAMLRIATAQFFLPAHVVLPLYPTEAELVELVRWFIAMFERPPVSSVSAVPLNQVNKSL